MILDLGGTDFCVDPHFVLLVPLLPEFSFQIEDSALKSLLLIVDALLELLADQNESSFEIVSLFHFHFVLDFYHSSLSFYLQITFYSSQNFLLFVKSSSLDF